MTTTPAPEPDDPTDDQTADAWEQLHGDAPTTPPPRPITTLPDITTYEENQ